MLRLEGCLGRTSYLPKTERSWALIHHKEFTTNGTGPKYIRLTGKVIYRLCDIEAYENECLVSSTAEFRKHTKLSAI